MKARITSPLLYNPQWLPLVGMICAVMRRCSQDDDAEWEKSSERYKLHHGCLGVGKAAVKEARKEAEAQM